ncbi:unnamed protein product [Durusdinium trenchii]|uniref:Secreted protein n=1 Tax=Durusdinium trenchii TaxID=1381693 RepID=A0ABP0KWR0_9DINO
MVALTFPWPLQTQLVVQFLCCSSICQSVRGMATKCSRVDFVNYNPRTSLIPAAVLWFSPTTRRSATRKCFPSSKPKSEGSLSNSYNDFQVSSQRWRSTGAKLLENIVADSCSSRLSTCTMRIIGSSSQPQMAMGDRAAVWLR